MSVHTRKKTSGIFASLSDDLLGLVINKVKDKRDRKSFSEVCKQWFKVEGLDRSKLIFYVNDPGFSLSSLARFPKIVTLTLLGCKFDIDLEFIAQTCPRIERIMIVGRDVELKGNSGVVELVHSARKLKSLILINTKLISDGALSGIGSTSSISILELINCCNITDEGLASLANGSISKTLKKLIIAGPIRSKFCKITDTGIKILCKMCCLEYLKLSFWGTTSRITDIGGVGIAAIQTLKDLTLNFLDVSDLTMVTLAQNCRNLEILDIRGCQKVTGAGICAFCSHKCLKSLNLDYLMINLSDVEQIVFGCPSLDSVLVDSRRRRDPTWNDELMQNKTRKVVKFV
ncbi:PREDICTED: F-box/LRR-repeat protein 20-like [Fragaria vesca subsp. vesca]